MLFPVTYQQFYFCSYVLQCFYVVFYVHNHQFMQSFTITLSYRQVI